MECENEGYRPFKSLGQFIAIKPQRDGHGMTPRNDTLQLFGQYSESSDLAQLRCSNHRVAIAGILP